MASQLTDTESSTLPGARDGVFGAVVATSGVFLAAWVAAGRSLFGVGGSLTVTYALTIGIVLALLHLFIGRGILRTARRGYRTRSATIGTGARMLARSTAALATINA